MTIMDLEVGDYVNVSCPDQPEILHKWPVSIVGRERIHIEHLGHFDMTTGLENDTFPDRPKHIEVWTEEHDRKMVRSNMLLDIIRMVSKLGGIDPYTVTEDEAIVLRNMLVRNKLYDKN